MWYTRGVSRVYDELIEFIAGGHGPDEVAAYQPPEATRRLVFELLERRKSGSLSAEQEAELNRYLELEHLMRMAKVRARQKGRGA